MKYPAQSDLWRLDQSIHAKPQAQESTKSQVLGQFKQVFPLSILTGELIIEERRIIWIQKSAPWSRDVISIMATDIACVNASSGPFFGHIHVKSLTGGPEIVVNNLFREDVYKIRSLVEGIAMASREGLKINNESIETERENFLKAGNIPS